MRWNWPAIFWFLSIVSAVVFVAIVFFLPETCRRLVGNGSVRPPVANRALLSQLCPKREPRASSDQADGNYAGFKRASNPFAGLNLLRNRGTALAIVCYGIYYTVCSCLQASLSTIFVDIYGVSGLIAGLSYLPYGFGCVSASTLAGE